MIDVATIRHEMAELHDSVTGLPGVGLLFDRVQQAVLLAKREEFSGALMLLRVDPEPDNEVSSRSLQNAQLEIAFTLRKGLRFSDSLGILGAREFAILLPETNVDEGAHTVAERLVPMLQQILLRPDFSARLRPSIGIASFPHTHDTIAGLYGRAQLAQQQAWAMGGGYVIAGETPPPATGSAAAAAAS